MSSPLGILIESLAYHGDGVAHLPDGRVVFVKDTAPGDRVQIEVLENHKRYALARVTEFVSASSIRVEPLCPYYKACGGCPWQHLAYDEQRKWKQRFVVEALQRIGGVTDPGSLVGETQKSSRNWGYRNKIELDIQTVERSVRLGFHAHRRQGFVPIESCQLLPRALRDAPRRIAGALAYSCREITPFLQRVGIRVSEQTNDIELSLWTDPCRVSRPLVSRVLNESLRTTSLTRVILDGSTKERKVKQVEALSGRGYWRDVVDERILKLSAPSFFQVNSSGTQILVSTVLEFLERAGIGEYDHVVDLYAGAGTFTLPLAARYHNVSAVESYRWSVRDLRRNLEDHQLDAHVVGGDVTRELASLEPFSAAVIDPPRNGLTTEARAALIAARPYCIVYVSCNPSTLARDIRSFTNEGYQLVFVRPVDLFPQTYHIESVSLLLRAPGQ